MTGSGKTGLCVALLEEAAIDGIPAIVIDPKGDLANLHAHLPRSLRGGLPAVDQRGGGGARGRLARRVRGVAGGALAEGARRVGPVRRENRAAQERGGFRDLHAGQRGGPSRVDPRRVQRAAQGDPRGQGSSHRANHRPRRRAFSVFSGSQGTRSRAASTSSSPPSSSTRGKTDGISISPRSYRPSKRRP